MPTLAVAKTFLFKLLGKEYTQEQFEDLCFEFGVELDDVTSQKEMFMREHGKDAEVCKKAEKLSDEVIYKIDTPANRYDLLSAEGMCIALRVFLGTMPLPRVKVLKPQFTMTVAPAIENVRDYVVCAVLRNINFDSYSYNSFIDFQEKLHSGLARKRTLASVGTHDLDKVKGPNFYYEATKKEEIKFVPLNQNGRMLHCAKDGLADYYKDDKHIGKYIPLISHFERYPVIYDASRTVLSLPPIINSDFSKIDMSTKNIFIECTAPDHHKAHVLVNQMICAFSMYCDGESKFTVEGVEVIYPKEQKVLGGKKSEVTPNLAWRDMEVDINSVNRKVGIDITADKCAELLHRMMLDTHVEKDTIKVSIPPVRSDILHPCDLIEDVAIGYGYDNIVMQEPPCKSHGYQTPMNKLGHLLRLELASAGYTEMLTLSLCSRDEAFKHIGRKDDNVAVHIANPQTIEFQVVRPSLLPGTLKTLQANKGAPLPMRLFEVSDVVLMDPAHRAGARNERHVCAVFASAEHSGFESTHGLTESLLYKIGVEQKPFGMDLTKFMDQVVSEGHADGDFARCYFFEEYEEGAFFPGRALRIQLATRPRSATTGDAKSISVSTIGHLGVVHPHALKAYDIPFPVSYLEFDLEPLK